MYLFWRISLVALFFLGINSLFFINFTGGISGFSISIDRFKESIFSMSEMPLLKKTFFIAQWSLIFLLLVYAGFRDIVVSRKKESLLNVHFSKTPSNRTDLDTLYEMLQKNKKISIAQIAKNFKIDEKIAFEWGKILESGNLAEIVDPGFGAPFLMIKKEQETLGEPAVSFTPLNNTSLNKDTAENSSRSGIFTTLQPLIKKLWKKDKKKKKRKSLR